MLLRENPAVRIPELPSRRIFGNKFHDSVIDERRQGFQKFLQAYTLIYLLIFLAFVHTPLSKMAHREGYLCHFFKIPQINGL
jgi:hypothetical protein